MRFFYASFFICILSLGVTVQAAEDCPPAAEVAELQNPNLYKDCDYSNEGLNGMLHRAFAKKKEDSGSLSSDESITTQKSEQLPKASQKIKKSRVTQVKLFRTANQLIEVRADLLMQQIQVCKGVLNVVSEQYQQVDSGNELHLTTECQ